MAHIGQVIENPLSGERIVFRQTAADTGGRLVAFDLALSIGFAAAVVWLVRHRGGPGERPGEGRARQILAERYARGEISADEYRERIEELDR